MIDKDVMIFLGACLLMLTWCDFAIEIYNDRHWKG